MVTVVIRRTEEPKVIQMTQADLARQLGDIDGAEIILSDTWSEGLAKVRTPYVTVVEPDCVFSGNYFSSNVNLFKKTMTSKNGGFTKLAVIASCIGVRDFGNRIYHYNLSRIEREMAGPEKNMKITEWGLKPIKEKPNKYLYQAQVAFIPGAVIRTAAIKDLVNDPVWEDRNLLKLSASICLKLWDTQRYIQVNPNTTYVSLVKELENPWVMDFKVPSRAATLFEHELIGSGIL